MLQQPFIEAIYFKQIVGDFVLDRLFGTVERGRAVPPDFGARLSASNVDEVLAAIRAGRSAYERTHLADVVKIRGMVAQAKHLAAEPIASLQRPSP